MRFLVLSIFLFLSLTVLADDGLKLASLPVSHPKNLALLTEKFEASLPERTDSAYHYARLLEKYARQYNLTFQLAQSQHWLGRVFFAEAAFNQSLDYLLKAERIWEQDKKENSYSLAINSNWLGQVYYYLRQPEKALSRYRTALAYFTASGSNTHIARTYGHLGHYYEKKGQYDSAIYYQKQALGLLQDKSEWKARSIILENTGSIYEDLMAYDTARHYFQQALDLTLSHGGPAEAIHLYNNLGDVHYKTHRYDSAYYYTAKATDLAFKHQDKYQLRSALRDLGQLQASLGQYPEAYASLDSSVGLYKEIYSEEGLRQMARLHTIYETDRKSREIQLLEKDKRIQRLIMGLSGMGFGVALLLGFTVVKRQRRKLRANRHTITKNKELYEARQKLMEAELVNAHLSEEQLKTELENQRQALTAHTLHLIRKNHLLQELKEGLQQVPTRDAREIRKHLKNLNRQIDQSFTEDKDWEDFRKMFEQVHHSFFDHLQQRFPDLTQAELRLSALIKMHLGTKDTAAMLGISPDSLRIARYRLRKKLQLEKGQKLDAFVQGIG
ncbi:tetratricopeptide repeat protein [Roseivirga sp. BDSF3-8]|uniref:tetratricopeptide repeat protein n=1 Tax=Roseivirga sp. BDSF3-8 TaxID=3241598 RepID=UPI003532652C